jgi:hypothetical protein
LLPPQEIEDDDEAGDDGDDEELAAEDEELLTAAADLLPALAISMGSDAYAPVFFAMHAEPLLARLKPQQPIALRAIAAGAIAEVAEQLGPNVADVAPVLLPLLLREMQAEVRLPAASLLFLLVVFIVCQRHMAAGRLLISHRIADGVNAADDFLGFAAGCRQPPERRLLLWTAGSGQPTACQHAPPTAVDCFVQHVWA